METIRQDNDILSHQLCGQQGGGTSLRERRKDEKRDSSGREKDRDRKRDQGLREIER